MTSDYGVMAGAYGILATEMGDRLPVFHYVPVGVRPPYAVLELGEIGVGNGLPSPHFQTRGTLKIRVWSAYEGTSELGDFLAQLSSFFSGRRVNLALGVAWFEVREAQWVHQQATAKNPWREGRLELEFVLKR